MKRVLLLFLCLLFVSCSSVSLEEKVTGIVAADVTLGAGSILCYGRMYENAMPYETLCDYLGLEGYPAFAGKIEEMAVYASLNGAYCELAVLRLYDAADAADAKLFLERRIADTKRALRVMGKKGYADTAFVEARGNTVALFMMPENSKIVKKVFS